VQQEEWIILATPLAMSSTASAASLLQIEWSLVVFLAFSWSKLLKKAMASSCAGLRVLRRSSNSCITPYAGSCKDCKKVNGQNH